VKWEMEGDHSKDLIYLIELEDLGRRQRSEKKNKKNDFNKKKETRRGEYFKTYLELVGK
jgi:hypothetical protein